MSIFFSGLLGPTNTTTNGGGVKNAVDFFNSQQQPVSSPTTKSISIYN